MQIMKKVILNGFMLWDTLMFSIIYGVYSIPFEFTSPWKLEQAEVSHNVDNILYALPSTCKNKVQENNSNQEGKF